MDIPPEILKQKAIIQSDIAIRVFWAVYCIGKLLPKDQDWSNFISELEALFQKYPKVDKDKMGFPGNWLVLVETNSI